MLITDNDESRFKPISNFDGGGLLKGRLVNGGNSSSGGAGDQSTVGPVMRIVITDADEVEKESERRRLQLCLEEEKSRKEEEEPLNNGTVKD